MGFKFGSPMESTCRSLASKTNTVSRPSGNSTLASNCCSASFRVVTVAAGSSRVRARYPCVETESVAQRAESESIRSIDSVPVVVPTTFFFLSARMVSQKKAKSRSPKW